MDTYIYAAKVVETLYKCPEGYTDNRELQVISCHVVIGPCRTSRRFFSKLVVNLPANE